MDNKNKANRFYELEGLRGLASIVVVLYHYGLAFYLVTFWGLAAAGPIQHMKLEDNLYGTPIMGLVSGVFAVAIFFVLSGFVLSIGFFQTDKMSIVKKLAAKRYLRLMLPALASIVICYLLIKLGFSHTAPAGVVTGSGWLGTAWQFTPHLFEMIRQGTYGIFVDGQNPYNNVLWTMTTEFLGSFIIFGVLLLFARSKYRWIVYGLLVIATFNTWFLAFVIGMVLADLYANGIFAQQKRNLLFAVPILLLGLYLGGCPLGVDLQSTSYSLFSDIFHTSFDYKIILTTVGASLLVFSLLWVSQFAKILRMKHISVLGKYTFSLYLVHLPVLYTFTTGVFLALHDQIGYNKAVAVAMIATIPLLIGVTVLFEKYIDRNAIRFSSYCASIYFGERQLQLNETLLNFKINMQLKIDTLRSRSTPELSQEQEIE